MTPDPKTAHSALVCLIYFSKMSDILQAEPQDSEIPDPP